MIAATPAPSNFFASSMAPSVDASAQPSTATLPPRASMPTAILPGKAPAGFLHQLRIAHRDRAEDDARQALVEPVLDIGQRADAAAELHRVPRRLQDRLDRRAIDRTAGEGAVEIDHMQPFETLVLEGLGLRGRVGVVDRRLVHVAELEANALRRP